MINDWKDRAKRQLDRVKKSGLYEAADEIFFIATDAIGNQESELASLMAEFPKIQVELHNRNWYEGFALRKVDFLGRTSEVPKKILYFHSKGVFNVYKNFATKEVDHLKISSVNSWVDAMEFFLIDNWRDCIEKLDFCDTVGTSIYAYWYWGNFWWANSEYIKTNVVFDDYFGGSRWQCESWLHDSNTNREAIKYSEFYHFNYNPFYTTIPSYIYDYTNKDGIEFSILEAKYGYFANQLDEGRGLEILEDMVVDVTERASEINRERTANKNILLNPEELTAEDPAPGIAKSLRLKFKTNKEDSVYTVTSFFSNPVKLLL